MDEITKERMEVWDRRLEGGLDGGDVKDVLNDWERDVDRIEKSYEGATTSFLGAMNLANKSMDLSVYLGEKMKLLEDHIALCDKIIDKMSGQWVSTEDYLKEVGYWEATDALKNLRIDNKKYEEIRERLDLLNALEQAGVDNWTGYGDAWEIFNEQNG